MYKSKQEFNEKLEKAMDYTDAVLEEAEVGGRR